MNINVKDMARSKRIMIQLGEYYQDILALDAWITGRTPSAQAGSLLGAKLQEREAKVKERLVYLANKRNITMEELRTMILSGDIENEEIEE